MLCLLLWRQLLCLNTCDPIYIPCILVCFLLSIVFCTLYRYDYTSFCTDVSKFPTPQFASEFGFQSYPSFASLAKISTQVVG